MQTMLEKRSELKADAVPIDDVTISYFWERVDRSGDCWLWTGTVLKVGYGQVMTRKKRTTAHRLSWVIANNRALPKGLMVLHRCNVRLCVRPEHIYIGDFSNNLKDQVLAGTHPLQRHNRKPGVHYGFRGKLDLAKAETIRGLHLRGRSLRSIAEEFDVSSTAVWQIVKGNTYTA